MKRSLAARAVSTAASLAIVLTLREARREDVELLVELHRVVQGDLVHDGAALLELLRQLEEVLFGVQEQGDELLVAPPEDGRGDLGALGGVLDLEEPRAELPEEVDGGLGLPGGVLERDPQGGDALGELAAGPEPAELEVDLRDGRDDRLAAHPHQLRGLLQALQPLGADPGAKRKVRDLLRLVRGVFGELEDGGPGSGGGGCDPGEAHGRRASVSRKPETPAFAAETGSRAKSPSDLPRLSIEKPVDLAPAARSTYFCTSGSIACPLARAVSEAFWIWSPITFRMSDAGLPTVSSSAICSVSFFGGVEGVVERGDEGLAGAGDLHSRVLCDGDRLAHGLLQAARVRADLEPQDGPTASRK